MPKARNIKLFLEDILKSINNINEYTQGMGYEKFKSDRKTVDAVVRNLEIIGEATKNIPDKIKKKYPEVDWKGAAGMRDKLSHEYFGVDEKILWKTVKGDIPAFEIQIKNIREKLQLADKNDEADQA